MIQATSLRGHCDQTQTNEATGGSRWPSLKIFCITAIGLIVYTSTINYGCSSTNNYYTTKGFVMWHRGDCKEAVDAFDEVLKSDPNNAEAYYGLGGADQCLGQYDAAIKNYGTAIRLDPRSPVYDHRAYAYEEIDDYPRASGDFDEAIHLNPENYSFYLQRSDLYARSGQFGAAEADRDKATARAGDQPPAAYFNEYAWFLATEPDKQARNAPLALQYALKAADLSYWEDPLTVDTVAAAYAENGRFDEAIKWQKKACDLHQTIYPGSTFELQEMKARLVLYQNHKPYRVERIAAHS